MNTGMLRHLAIPTIVSALLLTGCSTGSDEASSEDTLTPITITSPPSVFAVPMYLGIEEGIFEDHGFDVTIQTGTGMAESMPLLINGETEYIFADVHNTLLAQQEEMPIVISAPNSIQASVEPEDKGFGNLMVAEDSDINELSDLEGRQIATNTINGQAHLDNTTYLEAKGVDTSSIEWVAVPLEQSMAGLKQGQFDAVTISEPSGTIAMLEGGVRMLGSANAALPESPMFGFAALDTYIDENPKQAARFQEAILEANRLANSDRDAVERVLPKIMDLPEEAIGEVVLPPFAEEPFEPADSEPVLERLKENGILPEDADVDLDALFPVH